MLLFYHALSSAAWKTDWKEMSKIWETRKKAIAGNQIRYNGVLYEERRKYERKANVVLRKTWGVMKILILIIYL